MRPRKPRFIDGVQLADNLYLSPRKTPGQYLYIRPDGSRKLFSAPTVEEANRLAEAANALRHEYAPSGPKQVRHTRGSTAYHLPAYIEYREMVNPALRTKTSWRNRKYALQQFAEVFPRLGEIDMVQIRKWWDGCTHSQQKLRMAEFRRFFNWLMGECLVPRIKYNPFTTADDVSRLMLREKAPKKREPLTEQGFQRIYMAAGELEYEALQLAMDIGLYTMLRESDLARLKFDDCLKDDEFRLMVGKSEAQRGHVRATRLTWNLKEHPKLRGYINRARELSLKNKRCPFVISHYPKKRVWNEDKEHICQVLPERLGRMFNEAMKAAGIENTSFHEIRGLAITLYRKANHSLTEIKDVAAHESVDTTLGYLNLDELPYEEVKLKL